MKKINEESKLMKKALSKNNRTEVSCEYTLPDYYPDIKRVLHVFPCTRNTEVYVSDDKIEYDGNVCCGVLYRGEDKTLQYAEMKTELHDSINTEESGSICDISLEEESITVRAADPRKLTLKAKIKASADVYAEESIQPVYGGVDVNEENIQKKTSEIKLSDTFVCTENGIGMSEDIIIPDRAPQAERVVLVSLVPLASEISVENGKANVRTEAKGFVIYETPSDKETPQAFVLPVSVMLSHMVNCGEITENSVCTGKTVIYDITASVAEDTQGEKRVIELDFLYDIKLTCKNEGVTAAVSDVYCVSCGCDVKRKDISVESNVSTVKGNFSINYEIPQDIAQKIDGDVLFASGNIEDCSVSVCTGKLECSGSAEITVVYGDEEYDCVRFLLPFKGELDSPFKSANEVCTSCCKCTDVKIRCDGERCFADAEIYVDAMVCEKNTASVVDTAEFTEKCQKDSPSAFTIYYPTQEETLWDVAKKYGVFANDLQKANGTYAEGSNKKVILIPKAKKRV